MPNNLEESQTGECYADLTARYLKRKLRKVKENLERIGGGARLYNSDRRRPWIVLDLWRLLEVDDKAGGYARAIGARGGRVEANVVHLWAEGQVRKQADVHAATNAIGKLVGRAARSGC